MTSTDTESLDDDSALAQFRRKVEDDERGPTDYWPLKSLDPLQSPLAEQEVASLELQLSDTFSPDDTLAADAARSTVGVGKVDTDSE